MKEWLRAIGFGVLVRGQSPGLSDARRSSLLPPPPS